MPKTPPSSIVMANLMTKKMATDRITSGIMYLAPSFFLPLLMRPSTREPRMQLVMMNTSENIFMKSMEMLTEDRERGIAPPFGMLISEKVLDNISTTIEERLKR